MEMRPVVDHPFPVVAEAMNRGFEGYFVPVRMTASALARSARAEHLDPLASRVLYDGDAIAGVVLVARRGFTSRVTAFGIAPHLRGTGEGRRVMERILDEARERGDRSLELEVIEQNVPARRLYERLGFVATRRLVGWRKERRADEALPSPGQPETTDADALVEIDPLRFSRVVAKEGAPDLPWVLAAESFVAASAPSRAFSLEDKAWALVFDPGAETLSLSALIVAREARRQGWGARLARALEARFPARSWSVTPVVPEGLACGLFAQLGWQPHPLRQLEMRLSLR